MRVERKDWIAGGGVGLLLLRGTCAGELALIKTAAQNINAWTALLLKAIN